MVSSTCFCSCSCGLHPFRLFITDTKNNRLKVVTPHACRDMSPARLAELELAPPMRSADDVRTASERGSTDGRAVARDAGVAVRAVASDSGQADSARPGKEGARHGELLVAGSVVPPTWGVGVVARYLLGRNGAEACAHWRLTEGCMAAVMTLMIQR